MKSFAVTHVGLTRANNQDRYLVKEMSQGCILLAVADGMGGHSGGELAAEIVCRNLSHFDVKSEDVERELTHLAQQANREILDLAGQQITLEGMGTTLTAALVRDHVASWVHVGDSRLYLVRQGILVQITDDHTFLGIMVQDGEISAEEARVHPMRNVLLSCIGREPFKMDTGILPLESADLLVLSTDGLHDRIPEQRLASILVRTELGLEAKLDALLNAALSAGGKDNITIVALEI